MAPLVLWRHLQVVKQRHEDDLRTGLGRVALPNALERKYPNAGKEWAWQWVFPASSHYTDRTTGEKRRHHLHESVIQRAVSRRSLKPASPNLQVVIPSAILSPRIYWKTATTSGRSRSCLGIGTSARR